MSDAAVDSKGSSREVMSYLAVGGVGFLIEAVILTVLTQFAGWSPWLARVPSFVTAVLATWVLNRRHTFPERGLQRRSLEAFFYMAIQSAGVAINLAIYSVCLMLLPQLVRFPVIALAAGSLGGLVSNYLFNSRLLYARSRTADQR
ncbi:GtrA family protein [Peristeroidobacter agariperforans]|uniref:GtrA family protein n=1 Tax=Peristeroidobacter agariperforans TaxID=268404 RepID=UPI00101DEE4D|nr:GtrA family protein [Peristeroidobacter agariperforans]